MKKLLDRSLFNLSCHLFISYWPYYIGAGLCLFGTHYVQSILPFLAKEVADKIVVNIDSIELLPFIYTAVGIIVFRTMSRLLFFLPARILQKDLRVELVEALEKAFPERYRKYPDGQIFQVIAEDMEQIRALMGFAYMQVGNVIIALLVLLPKLSAFNSKLVLCLLPMAIAFIIFSIATSFTKELYRKNQDAAGDLQNYLIESYKGKKTIKNYQAESDFLEMFKKYSFIELKHFYNSGMIVAWAMPLIALGVGLSFVWGASVIRSEDLGANSLILFSGFIFLFMEPLSFVSWIGVVFSRSFASWQRIKNLYSDISQKAGLEIQLESYEQDREDQIVIPFWDKKISIPLSKERWLALVGETGVGKSEALRRVADVLILNNKKVSYVAQNPYLYNDSIQNNIFLGHSPSADDIADAKKLLELFELNILQGNLSDLLKLEVGEHGKELSGGQIKRLCLVRSIFNNSDYILWDDPFSSVDLILERNILKKLKINKRIDQRKIILTTHRLSTLRQSDEVVYLEKEVGVLESGSVGQLLGNKNKLYEFFEKQMG